MLEIRNVLYPTDFSPCSEQALDHALYFAERLGARLHVLHVITLHEADPYNPAHHFPHSEDLFDRLLELAREEMKRLRTNWSSVEVEVVESERRGIHAAPAILDYAQQEKIDLILMGTHGRRGPAHFFLGSVAEEVVRHAECPVMTLREIKKGERSIESIERILVPIDFSDPSLESLDVASELATGFGARLDLLHVVERLIYPGFYGAFEGAGPLAVDDHMLREKSQEALADLMSQRPGVLYEAHTISGPSGPSIVSFAEESGADLIVMATQGLSGIKRLMLGSTAEQVVRTARCPVLTLHAAEKPE